MKLTLHSGLYPIIGGILIALLFKTYELFVWWCQGFIQLDVSLVYMLLPSLALGILIFLATYEFMGVQPKKLAFAMTGFLFVVIKDLINIYIYNGLIQTQIPLILFEAVFIGIPLALAAYCLLGEINWKE